MPRNSRKPRKRNRPTMDTPEQTQAPAATAAVLGDNLTPPGAASTIEQQLAALQQQVAALLAIQQGNMQLMAGVMSGVAPAAKPTDTQLQAAASAEPLPVAKPMPRVRIMLEDNDNIPPGGQFISIDGVPYLLQPNMEADVPVNVLDVLDHAIMSVPVTDENRNVIGYRDRLRFPYRVIRDRQRDIEQREADIAAGVGN